MIRQYLRYHLVTPRRKMIIDAKVHLPFPGLTTTKSRSRVDIANAFCAAEFLDMLIGKIKIEFRCVQMEFFEPLFPVGRFHLITVRDKENNESDALRATEFV